MRKLMVASLAIGALILTTASLSPARAQGMAPTEAQLQAHPDMAKAIEQLQNVANMLQTKAEHDFAGHRVKAIALIQKAIGQLQTGIMDAKH